MARRAGFIQNSRILGPTLHISGPNELTTSSGDPAGLFNSVNSDLPSDKSPANRQEDIPYSTLRMAYNTLGVDSGYINATAARKITSAGYGLPENFTAVDQKPVVQHCTVNADGLARRIAIVLFPQISKKHIATGNHRIHPIMNDLVMLATKLRPANTLVIGVSPWGRRLEQNFLETARGSYDIILGGGPGKGMRGNMDMSGSVLWARGFAKGKTASLIDLKVWPERSADWNWLEGLNVSFPVVPLDHTIQSAPETMSILNRLQ